MTELYMEYGTMVLMALLSGIAWVGLRYGLELVKSKKMQGLFMRFAIELRAVVVEVNASYVDALKAAKEGDGKLTAEEKSAAFDMAMSNLKSNLGVKGLARLVKALGIEGLESWLATHITGMVEEVKTPPKP